MVLAPLLTLILFSVVWTIGTFIAKRCKPRDEDDEDMATISVKRLINRISIITGMCLFLIYPSICEILLQSLNCFPSLTEDGPGDTIVTRLRIYPNIMCTDDEYLNYRTFVFIPFLILYVIVIPVSALWYMQRVSQDIYLSSEPNFRQNNTQTLMNINHVKSKYGFFYAGLKLGQESSAIAVQQNDHDEDDENGDGKKNGRSAKCKSCCKNFISPISGAGVRVLLSNKPRDNYVYSWYHWEFVIYF